MRVRTNLNRWTPVEIDPTVPNPIVATRYALDGGTARLYADGNVCAVDGEYYSISPGFDSFEELQAWIARKCKF